MVNQDFCFFFDRSAKKTSEIMTTCSIMEPGENGSFGLTWSAEAVSLIRHMRARESGEGVLSASESWSGVIDGQIARK